MHQAACDWWPVTKCVCEVPEATSRAAGTPEPHTPSAASSRLLPFLEPGSKEAAGKFAYKPSPGSAPARAQRCHPQGVRHGGRRQKMSQNSLKGAGHKTGEGEVVGEGAGIPGGRGCAFACLQPEAELGPCFSPSTWHFFSLSWIWAGSAQTKPKRLGGSAIPVYPSTIPLQLAGSGLY